MSDFIRVKKLQDSDGHWYWIPLEEVDKFEQDSRDLDGMDYMDCPDKFDDFSDNYEKYRTGGDPDNVPDYFANGKNK